MLNRSGIKGILALLLILEKSFLTFTNNMRFAVGFSYTGFILFEVNECLILNVTVSEGLISEEVSLLSKRQYQKQH